MKILYEKILIVSTMDYCINPLRNHLKNPHSLTLSVQIHKNENPKSFQVIIKYYVDVFHLNENSNTSNKHCGTI